MDPESEVWAWPPLPKWLWGPRGWNWLHTAAIRYPHTPSQVDARAAARRIWAFASHLPCAECRGHATRFIAQNPPALASTHAFQAWAWDFHNTVNRRLGKPVIPYEEYLRLYADEICWATSEYLPELWR